MAAWRGPLGVVMLFLGRTLGLSLPKKGPINWRRYAAITTSGATAVFAGFELSESLFELGHHHGLALIALSKMAQATALELRAGEEAAEETRLRAWCRRRFAGRPVQWVRLLCVAALLAALYEVYGDLRPGGHHGTALIALAELRDTTEGAVRKTRFNRFFIFNCYAKLLLGLGAFLSAAMELSRNFFKAGAHHGSFILATSIVIKTAGETITTILNRPKHDDPIVDDQETVTSPKVA